MNMADAIIERLERAYVRDHYRVAPCRSNVPPQRQAVVKKSLNIHATYVQHLSTFAGTRELCQNWYDQCVLLSRSGCTRVEEHDQRNWQDVPHRFFLLSVKAGEMIVCLKTFRRKAGPRALGKQ